MPIDRAAHRELSARLAANMAADNIIAEPNYHLVLKRFVHSEATLARNGYVLDQLSDAKLASKKRCDRCLRAVSPFRKGRKPDKPGASDTGWGAPTDKKENAESNAGKLGHGDGHIQAKKGVELPKPRDVKDMKCKFHPGTYQRRRWTCCGRTNGHSFCAGDDEHKPRVYGKGELEDLWHYYHTPAALPGSDHRAAVALDCEMGLSFSGELETIRVSVVDYYSGECVLDTFVSPESPIKDYLTRYSGITARDMDRAIAGNNCLFGRAQARQAVFRYIGPETIVICHGGSSDMNCLRWIHHIIVDTHIVEIEKRQKRREIVEKMEGEAGEAKRKEFEAQLGPGSLTLKRLALDRLNRVIQRGNQGHDSIEDAVATRDIAHWHVVETLEQEHSPLGALFDHLVLEDRPNLKRKRGVSI